MVVVVEERGLMVIVCSREKGKRTPSILVTISNNVNT